MFGLNRVELVNCDDPQFETPNATRYLKRKQDSDRFQSVGYKIDYVVEHYKGNQPGVLVIESPFRFKTTVVFGDWLDLMQCPAIKGAIRPWAIHPLGA